MDLKLQLAKMLWSFGGIVWKGIEQKNQGMGCSMPESRLPTTYGFFMIFQGAIFSFGFFGWQLPSDLRRAGLHPLYSQQSMLTFEGDQFQGPKHGDPGNNDGPPWGELGTIQQLSDPEEVFLGHVIYMYIYIYYYIYILLYIYTYFIHYTYIFF